MVVACDADAEDRDEDADELDGGFCVPCHGDCDYLLIWGQRNLATRFGREVLLLLFMVAADEFWL